MTQRVWLVIFAVLSIIIGTVGVGVAIFTSVTLLQVSLSPICLIWGVVVLIVVAREPT